MSEVLEGTKAKHTPGPWVAVDQGNRLDHLGTPYVTIFGGKSGGLSVASVHCVHPGNQPGDLKTARDANARLIAAAPELLAMLKQARECIAYCRRAHKDAQSGEGVPIELFIDEVIAKATGDAS